MGRGKVVLERIENKINRQVTFSKRKNGLMKKAQELAILCDSAVALIIFSNRGKLSEFASTDMDKILQRYGQYCYASQGHNIVENGQQSMYHEVSRLRAEYESLQLSQRHLLGEELEQLNVKELQKFERQLDKTLSQARQRKTRLLLDRLEDLRQREHDLREENSKLKNKLEERRQQNKANQVGGITQTQTANIIEASDNVNRRRLQAFDSLHVEPEPDLSMRYGPFSGHREGIGFGPTNVVNPRESHQNNHQGLWIP